MRKPDLHSRRLGPVRLYRGELDHVSALTAAPGKVEFRHDGFIYDTLNELAEHLKGKPARSIVIQPIAGDGRAAVSISPHQVEVFALSEGGEPADEIAAYLRSRVSGGRPLWWRVLYGAIVWLVSILIGAVALALSDVPLLGRSLFAGFVTLVMVSLLTGLQPAGESAVYLHDRAAPTPDRTPLILLVAAVSGLIGLALGVALG